MGENKSLKIGLVLSNLPGYSETFFINKIKSLNEEGHKVYLFVSGKKERKFKLAKVIYGPYLYGSKLRKVITSSLALLRVSFRAPVSAYKFIILVRNEGLSWTIALKRLVINSHILPHKLDWLHFGFATMGIGRELAGKAIGAKLAVSFRGYDISIYPLKHPGCYKRLWQNVDRVHTISDDLLEVAYSYGLLTNLAIYKITPAIDASGFLSSRSKFFYNDEIKILSVGRLHWKKGFEYTLEALAIIKETGINFNYTIVGDGDERERLLFASYQLGLTNNVTFTGRVNHSDIPQLMKGHDMYLQYSIQEGFCNSVLEAQAAGMLCVVSDAEGLSENVLNNRTGWVVPKRRPDLLAKKILEVIYMPHDSLLSISNTATERVRKEFNLEKQRREFVNFYKD